MDVDVEFPKSGRRTGPQTRVAAQRVALELFTAQGYESTSLRQIADVLGINKASLYYHFSSKEDILRSLFEERGAEAEQLVRWLAEQPSTPDLLEATVMRWVGSFSSDKLRGIRFFAANPLIDRGTHAADGERIGSGLNRLVDALAPLVPTPTGARLLLLRMAVLSINAAVEAAAGNGIADEDILEAAGQSARLLVRQLDGG